MRMTIIGQSGNVGIGIGSPTERLDIAGNIRMRTGANAGYILVSDAEGKMTWTDPSTISTSSPWIESGSNVYRTDGRVGIGGTPIARLHVRQDGTSISAGIRMTSSVNTSEDWYTYMNANDDLTFSDDGVDMLTLQNSTSNIGIGMASPTERLDVAGNIRMRTGAAVGYIPVSDADGKMTWTDPSTISTSSPWTESGSNVYRTDGRGGTRTQPETS
jgi:hypothetical protein